MDVASEQINAVVDNLADKIGIAAEKIIPVTETMVQEIHSGNMFGAYIFVLASCILAIMAVVCFVRSINFEKKYSSDLNANYVFGWITIIASLIVILISSAWFYAALTPTVTLVEKFLQ